MKTRAHKYFYLYSVITVVFCIVFSINTAVFASCDEYLREAEAVEGVVPRFNEDGTVRAFVIFGEGTFLTSKRSLISKARRKAELRAKRSFAEWMKQDLQSESVVTEMMEQEESTDEQGNTSGKVKELEAQIDIMRSSTNAVLSGIVKLDECVDKTEKFVLVTLGWKPNLSRAAARAKTSSEDKPGSEDTVVTAESGAANTQSTDPKKKKADKRTSSSSKEMSEKEDNEKSGSSIRIVTVEVEGRGTNLRTATADALRSAVAQTFGEKFASKIKSSELTETNEVTNSTGESSGVAVETSSTQTDMSSSTKGLIKSYEYIHKDHTDDGVLVVLRVKLPKFESAIDPSKTTIIVIHPKLSTTLSETTRGLDEFRNGIQDYIVDVINRSKKLAVLDRQYLGEQNSELRLLSTGNSPVSEMARIGNTVGADLMFITEISNYSKDNETKTIGNKKIKRSVFNSEVSINVIDVATTSIMFSKRIVFRNRKFKSPNPESMFAKKVGTKVGLSVANKLGGGVIREKSNFEQASSEESTEEVIKSADEQFDKAEKDVEDDW